MISDMFSANVFTRERMREYLTPVQFSEMEQGGRISAETADAVAEAMRIWATEQGATTTATGFNL